DPTKTPCRKPAKIRTKVAPRVIDAKSEALHTSVTESISKRAFVGCRRRAIASWRLAQCSIEIRRHPRHSAICAHQITAARAAQVTITSHPLLVTLTPARLLSAGVTIAGHRFVYAL